MRVLLTGGCGFIGSHACVVLLEAGYDVIIVDSCVTFFVKCLTTYGIVLKYVINIIC